MDAKLAQLASIAAQKDKQQGFSQLLQASLAQEAPADDTLAVVRAVVTDERVGLVVARQIITDLVKGLEAGAVPDSDIRKKIIQDTLEVLQPRIVSYEEQVRVPHSAATTTINNIARTYYLKHSGLWASFATRQHL